MTNSVDLDEVAHDKPPHQDLRCLQVQLFSSLVVNPIALRKAKTVYMFGLSECITVKQLSKKASTISPIKSRPTLFPLSGQY